MPCAIAFDTKLETPEGPFTVKTVGNSPTAVMTRTDDGATRFAMTVDVCRIAEAQPVLRITLDNGRALRVGGEQILFGAEMRELRAADLQAGDQLLSQFAFPVGYEYLTDAGEARVSDGTVAVTAVAAGGEADLYSLKVPRSGRFVFAAGVLGKSE
ncbi:MAG: hypothetical protein ACRERC_20230 [Candidatus Binatia bacterium]